MGTNIKTYNIGDFLKRIKRPIELEDDKEYKLVTIKLHHNGVTLRGMKKGSEIKSKMYEVKAGDFILSGIDARNGAFGIVPEELDGAIVTNDFWYFDIDENIIDKHFFLELTATEWFDEICTKGSDGTTQRIRLQKDKFFSQEISIPTLTMQEKIIKNFYKFTTFIYKVKDANEDQHNLVSLLRHQVLKEKSVGTIKLKAHVTHLTNRVDISIPNHRMIGVSNSDGITDLTTSKKDGFEKYKIVEKNNFIYNPMRINVGSIALYEGDDTCITSPDYVVFEVTNGYPIKALLFFLKSKQGLQEIAENVQGSVRQRLYFENLCAVNVPEFDSKDYKVIEDLFSKLDKLEYLLKEDANTSDLLRSVLLKEMFNK